MSLPKLPGSARSDLRAHDRSGLGSAARGLVAAENRSEVSRFGAEGTRRMTRLCGIGLPFYGDPVFGRRRRTSTLWEDVPTSATPHLTSMRLVPTVRQPSTDLIQNQEAANKGKAFDAGWDWLTQPARWWASWLAVRREYPKQFDFEAPRHQVFEV